MNIKKINFPDNQYYHDIQDKKQIVLHHTVSNPMSATGDIGYWESTSSRIATYIIIGYDGTINKCFKSNQWGHHLGIKQKQFKELGFEDYRTRNTLLNKETIGIEIDSWGGLTKKDGKFYNAYGGEISNDLDIVGVDWRGYKYFQKYSQEQIDALAELLPILMEAYNIPNTGLKNGDLDISMDALNGIGGIYSHTNYRSDKSDIYPDRDLIQMLNNI